MKYDWSKREKEKEKERKKERKKQNNTKVMICSEDRHNTTKDCHSF